MTGLASPSTMAMSCLGPSRIAGRMSAKTPRQHVDYPGARVFRCLMRNCGYMVPKIRVSCGIGTIAAQGIRALAGVGAEGRSRSDLL